jgi:hypothetical protein
MVNFWLPLAPAGGANTLWVDDFKVGAPTFDRHAQANKGRQAGAWTATGSRVVPTAPAGPTRPTRTHRQTGTGQGSEAKDEIGHASELTAGAHNGSARTVAAAATELFASKRTPVDVDNSTEPERIGSDGNTAPLEQADTVANSRSLRPKMNGQSGQSAAVMLEDIGRENGMKSSSCTPLEGTFGDCFQFYGNGVGGFVCSLIVRVGVRILHNFPLCV